MAARLELAKTDRATLEAWLRAPTLWQALALRARIILASADGEAVRPLAARLDTSVPTVCAWRVRFREMGLAGLQSRPMSGRPKRITSERIQAVLTRTLTPPKGMTHWSAARMAEEIGLSAATVLRIWRKHGLQPHRSDTFKFSTDPELTTKLADVIGLYLDPPERALVLCVDEKSQIQALHRTQPILPLRPGLPARMTHDYVRHGTTSLFAALEVASGRVHGRCYESIPIRSSSPSWARLPSAIPVARSN